MHSQLTSTLNHGKLAYPIPIPTLRPGPHQTKVGTLPSANALNLFQEGQQRRCSAPLCLLPKYTLSHSTVFPHQLRELLQSLGPWGTKGAKNIYLQASSLGWWLQSCPPMKAMFWKRQGKKSCRGNKAHIPKPDVGAPPTSSGPQPTRE